MYRHVLGIELGDLGDVVRARAPTSLPVVLTRAEVAAVLVKLEGVHRLTVLPEFRVDSGYAEKPAGNHR